MKVLKLKRIAVRLTILLAGAVLYALPTLQPRFAILAFAATIPWLLLILAPDLQTGERLPIWFLGLIYAIGLLSLHWLGNFNPAAWLISPLFYVPFLLPTFYVTRGVRARWPALPLSIIWGLSLTGTEWLRIRISPGEIPFCQLGASLVPFTKLIQIVDIAGASALTTIAALASGLVADVVVYFFSTAQPRSKLKLGLSAATVTAAFILTISYGYLSDRNATFSTGPRVEVIQPNMPGWGDDLSSHLKFQRVIDLTRANKPQSDVDLVVWPENSVIPPTTNSAAPLNDTESVVKALSRDVGVPILFDGPFDRQGLSERHRAALVQPDGTVAAYMKQVLVPWSEYAPFEPTLRSMTPALADKYLTFIKSRNPFFTATRVEDSSSPIAFRYSGHHGQPIIFGAPICYEILSARLVNRWYATLGNDEMRHYFLINQVNEILIGSSVHLQTLAFCQLRAVEGRVSVIRAANNGISAAIDPNGRVYDVLTGQPGGSPIDIAGAFSPRVILDTRAGRTIYARYGDWWPVTCLFLSLGLILFGYARSRWSWFTRSA
jgi:apolipoprotein N-acyltransferase